MNKLFGWCCVVGGFLWTVKPIYDALFNGRKLNQGYTPSDPSDYISFIFPLLCIGGLIVIHSLYKKEVRHSVIILIIAVISSSLFYLFEIYFYVKNTTILLTWTAFALFLDNLLLILLSFFTESLPEKITNPLITILFFLIGFIWTVFGLATLKLTYQDTINNHKLKN